MFGNKLSKKDETTRQLQASGVYSLGRSPHPFIVGDGTVEAVKQKKIYGFWKGVWYTAVLSLLLFWLPPFGQMVAGYVGGRKAGTPLKGVLATLLPMMFIFTLALVSYLGYFVSPIGRFLGIPGEAAGYLSNALPVFGPVFGFMAEYLGTFISSSIQFLVYPYVLTVLFGYVGGILSLQHRKEMEAEGKSHPFIAVVPVPSEQKDAEPETISEVPEKPPQKGKESKPMVLAKPSQGWKMKSDRKKGKW